MGTWGAGNFDGDTAGDFLSTITASLVKDITTAMNGDPVGLEPDEWDGNKVPGAIELLALIAAQHWVGTVLPKAADVRAWSAKFIGIWDATIDDLDPNEEWKVKRREVLVRTFDSLVSACSREEAS